MTIDQIKEKVAKEFGFDSWVVGYLQEYPFLNNDLLDATIAEAIQVGASTIVAANRIG